jgi:DNA polymerase-3 subunit beta
MEAEVDAPGQEGVIGAPVRLVGEILRALEAPTVSLLYQADERVLKIEAGRSRFSLRCYDPGDFPAVSAPEGPAFPVEAERLAEALRQVVRAAATEESRPVLQGVLLERAEDGLRLVATDSYRLAVKDVPGLGGVLGEGQAAIVPARALTELTKLLQAGPASVQVTCGGTDVRFDLGPARLTARLIAGEFPPYRQLLPAPADLAHRLVVDREALGAALRRVRLLAGEPTVPVRLGLSSEGLRLSAQTVEVGQADEDVEAKYEGDDFVIAFNPKYFGDALDAIATEKVVIEMSTPLKPALIHGEGEDDFRYLAMPVRVS